MATTRDSYDEVDNGRASFSVKARRRNSHFRKRGAALSTLGFDLRLRGLDGLSACIHHVSRPFWLAMVLGGIVAPCGGCMANLLWQRSFLVTITICGLSCLLNCYIRDPPYHTLPADAMVALVHVPCFYSVFMWRNLLGSETSPVWHALLTGSDEHLTRLKAAVKMSATLILPAQVATTVLVFAGYVVPTQHFVNETDESVQFTGRDPHILTKVHDYFMWVAIPPVVSCVMANAALFSFVVYAMYLQVDIVLEFMCEREHRLARHERDADTRHELTSIIFEDMSEACEEDGCAASTQSSPRADIAPSLEGHEYERFMETVSDDIFAMQNVIDDVCENWSFLVLLFLATAFGELLAVLLDLAAVYNGDPTFELTVAVYCIDTFLVVSGLGIVVGVLVMGAVLTQRMDELCVEGVQVMRAGNVPLSKAASAYVYLQTGGRKASLGFKVYSYRIQWSHVFGFVSIFVTIVGFIMNGPNGGTLPHVPHGLKKQSR